MRTVVLSFILSCGLSFSTIARADVQVGGVGVDGAVESGLKMSDQESFYNMGRKTNAVDLVGSWKAVEFVASEACAYQGKNSASIDGIQNPDGSIPTLVFSKSRKNSQSVSVRLLNFDVDGHKSNQGPYKVSDQEPQFVQSGYNPDNGQILTQSYFLYSCRFDAHNNFILICAVKMKIAPQVNWAQETVQCANDRDYSMIISYEKE